MRIVGCIRLKNRPVDNHRSVTLRRLIVVSHVTCTVKIYVTLILLLIYWLNDDLFISDYLAVSIHLSIVICFLDFRFVNEDDLDESLYRASIEDGSVLDDL